MVQTIRSYSITIDRGSKGFGLSLMYRGTDRYVKKETGIFVAKVISGGQAERSGVLGDDKVLTINGITPKDVDHAVDIIKGSKTQIKLIITRKEEAIELDTQAARQKSFASTQKLSPSLGLYLEKEHPVADSQPIYANVPISKIGKNNHASDRSSKPPTEHVVHVELQKENHSPPSVGDTVRGILETSPKFGNVFKFENSEYPSAEVKPEPKVSPVNIKRTILRGGPLRASMGRLNEIRPESNINSQFRQRSNSMSRMTRKEEKSALEGLNNRLAGYIDKVRTLQNKNQTLYHQIRTFEEYKQVEIDDVKDLYEKQVEELKRALEVATKNYDQLKSGSEGILNENRVLRDKMEKIETDVSNAMDKENTFKNELWNLGNKISRTEYELRENQNQLRNLIPELKDLQDRIGNAKMALDQEKLKSSDLENKSHELEEKLKDKTDILERELVNVRYQKETEINTIDGTLQYEYENRLQDELQKLRDMYDNKMDENKEHFEERYQNRFRQLQSELTRKHGSSAGSTQELKEARSRIEALLRKISELERENLALNQKIADMAQELKDQPTRQEQKVLTKDVEIKRLIDELSDQMREYQNLHELKIALDMEIAVFHRLLETEEDRFDEIKSGSNESNNDPMTIERRTTVLNSEKRLVHRSDDITGSQPQHYLHN